MIIMKKSILSFNLLLIALFASSFSVFSQEVVPVKVGGAEISFDKKHTITEPCNNMQMVNVFLFLLTLAPKT